MRSLCFSLFILTMSCTTMAQDISVKDFVGVWYSSNEKLVYSAIKITETEGEPSVKIKKATGLEKGINAYLKDNTLYWHIDIETNYGKWWIGSWNGESRHILVGKGYPHGTNGPVTGYFRAYYNQTANRAYCYIKFKATLDNDGLKVYTKHVSEYFSDQIPLFYQASNWDTIPYEFINW